MLAKRLVLLCFYVLVFAFRKRPSALLILTYHRISETPDGSDPLKVSVEAFDAQIQYLKEHFTIISAQEVREFIDGRRRLVGNACLITFDDGWADNFTNGLPILAKYKVPALIFLSTDFIDTGRVFWTVTLRSLLMQYAPNSGLDNALACWPSGIALKVRHAYGLDQDRRGEAINQIIECLKSFSTTEIDGFVSSLRALYSTQLAEGDGAMLSWGQVSKMQNCSVSFGSHAKSHAILTKLEENDCRGEIRGSRDVLESRLGQRVEFIAYPNGNFNEQVIRLTREAGYIAGFTCVPGLNRTFENPLELRRLNMRQDSGTGLNGLFSPLFFFIELSGVRFVLKGSKMRDWR